MQQHDGHVLASFTNIRIVNGACIFLGCKCFFWPQALGDCLHVRAVWLWFSVRMSKLRISTLYPVHERGVFPPKKHQQGIAASVKKAETASGVAVRTTTSSPFNPVPFNEEKFEITRHSSANTLSSSSAPHLSSDPNKVSDGAEKSQLISFCRQQYVDKSHGETGAPCLTL